MNKLFDCLIQPTTVSKFKEGTEVNAKVSEDTKNLIKEFVAGLAKPKAKINPALIELQTEKVNGNLVPKPTGAYFFKVKLNTNLGDIEIKYFVNPKDDINMLLTLVRHIANYDVTIVGAQEISNPLEYLMSNGIEFPMTYGVTERDGKTYHNWLHTTAAGYEARKAREAAKAEAAKKAEEVADKE